MPRLLPPEQVPRAPQLEVAQRDAVARSEIGVVLEHLEALLGLRIHLIGDEQVAGGAPVASADAPAQLIQLRQPELVRPVHDHRVRVGHVEPRLDDHRGYENVHLPPHEAPHHLVQLRFAQLPVRHRDAGAGRRQRAHPLRDRGDGLDAVVHEVRLPRPVELAGQRFFDEGVVPRLDERQHR